MEDGIRFSILHPPSSILYSLSSILYSVHPSSFILSFRLSPCVETWRVRKRKVNRLNVPLLDPHHVAQPGQQ